MFRADDVVEATADIVRHDGRSFLKKGGVAKVTSVYHTQSSQVVDIDIQGQLPIRDIVCFHNHPGFPLKKA